MTLISSFSTVLRGKASGTVRSDFQPVKIIKRLMMTTRVWQEFLWSWRLLKKVCYINFLRFEKIFIITYSCFKTFCKSLFKFYIWKQRNLKLKFKVFVAITAVLMYCLHSVDFCCFVCRSGMIGTFRLFFYSQLGNDKWITIQSNTTCWEQWTLIMHKTVFSWNILLSQECI